jgi:L-alanine-DL-glutamate epimerase-like enolase superfamily enzyme
VLFGDTGVETLAKAKRAREDGFRAVKFGWGPFGKGGPKEDQEQLVAAHEGLGPEGILLVDAGTVWGDDVQRAAKALKALRLTDALWLEEPFVTGALSAYAALAAQSGRVKLAAGEGCHNVHMAQHMLDYADLGYIQIDAGRIGGISAAKQVADMAVEREVTYVNHTFTSHLALSASLQPYAGLADHILCEYPTESSALAQELTIEHLRAEGEEGRIYLPDAPGHGMAPNLAALRKYVVDVEIRVRGKILYETPDL